MAFDRRRDEHLVPGAAEALIRARDPSAPRSSQSSRAQMSAVRLDSSGHAAEPDVARRRVHGLPLARRWTEAEAVVGRAQMRSALDDQAWRVGGRVDRRRSTGSFVRRRPGRRGHRSTPTRCRTYRAARNRSGETRESARFPPIRPPGGSATGTRPATSSRRDALPASTRPPRRTWPRRAPASRVLPLGLCGQRLARPSGVRLSVLIGDVHDRMVRAFVGAAGTPLGTIPACARDIGPPCRHVVERYRSPRLAEHRGAGDQQSSDRPPGNPRHEERARRA